MAIVFLGMIALFLVLGLIFSRGKGAFLIAGYNTASKAEKAKYDEKALCRFMGKIMFAMAGCQGVMALGSSWSACGCFGWESPPSWRGHSAPSSTPTPETASKRNPSEMMKG